MNLVEDALDILAFIALIGVAVAVAFGVVVPALNESSENDTSYTDKTAPTLVGDYTEPRDMGTYDKLDIMIMVQIQDFNIPNPKRYQVNSPDSGVSEVIDIWDLGAFYNSGPVQRDIVDKVNNVLSGDVGTDYKYKINYDYGVNEGKDDDMYIIEKQD